MSEVIPRSFGQKISKITKIDKVHLASHWQRQPLYMPAIVSRWSATLQPILFISIFIVVLIAIYTGQIKNTTYALDLNEKIDSSSNEDTTLHRRSYFYIGGEYVSAQTSMVSSGQVYVEHLVPIKVIKPFPIVFIPGNGMVTIIGSFTLVFEFFIVI